jgi:type III polyketide synthase
MQKIRAINQYTGIDTRSAIGTVDYPLANMDRAPTIAELCSIFLKDGVALAVTAARKALHEARLSPLDITHVVSTTCTNSANPGFDHYVCKELGVIQPVEKVLLHGIGCSGGLASLRTAANLALGSSFRGRRARVLVVALEISSLLVRSELDSVHDLQQTRIGVTLFSDCASACILSNGIGGEDEEPIYELLGWDHRVLPDTEEDLGFDVDPLGKFTPKSVLNTRTNIFKRMESSPLTPRPKTRLFRRISNIHRSPLHTPKSPSKLQIRSRFRLGAAPRRSYNPLRR